MKKEQKKVAAAAQKRRERRARNDRGEASATFFKTWRINHQIGAVERAPFAPRP